jgi:hypothetical protein
MPSLVRFALLLLLTPSAASFALSAHGTSVAVASWQAPRAAVVSAAKRPVKKTAKKSSGVDFSGTGSADADGYRRGSFGIGENESYVIWGIVLAALAFGGALDDETAQKIGEAQRSFYPKPPGL